eukprot:COSAG06_NODE_1156_length_10478_cov_5.792177_3_plen_41_part_00
MSIEWRRRGGGGGGGGGGVCVCVFSHHVRQAGEHPLDAQE